MNLTSGKSLHGLFFSTGSVKALLFLKFTLNQIWPIKSFNQSHFLGDPVNPRKYPLKHCEYFVIRVNPPFSKLWVLIQDSFEQGGYITAGLKQIFSFITKTIISFVAKVLWEWLCRKIILLLWWSCGKIEGQLWGLQEGFCWQAFV